MWIKILFVVILFAGLFIWGIIGWMDKKLSERIVDILKEERAKNPTKVYLHLNEIKSNLDAIWLDQPFFSNRLFLFMVKHWIVNEKQIRRRCHDQILILEYNEQRDHFGLIQKSEKVISYLNWNDETIYEWEIEKENISIWRGIIMAIFPWYSITILIFGLLWIIEFISPWLSILIGLYIIYEFIKIRIVVTKIRDSEDEMKEKALGKFMTEKTAMSLIGSAIATSTFLYFLTSPVLPNNLIFDNYTNNKLTWILFSIKNIIDALFNNVTDIIGFKLSSNEANSLLSRLILAALNFSIIYSFVSIISFIYKSQTQKKINYSGSVQQFYVYKMGNIIWGSKYLIRCKGRVEVFEKPIEFSGHEFDQTFQEDLSDDILKVNPFG